MSEQNTLTYARVNEDIIRMLDKPTVKWWGLFNKKTVYSKKCSSGCLSLDGKCITENPAPLGYKIIKNNSKLGGLCSNFGPFNATKAYPKIENGEDTFYFEPARGTNHVFCFGDNQDSIAYNESTIAVPAGSYLCDSANNVYYKKCNSGCAYTGFCGGKTGGEITHITYENNPYMFSFSKNNSCFDKKGENKDKYSCTGGSIKDVSWLWYCDGKRVYYMSCPESSCTDDGCKLNNPFSGDESVSVDYSVTSGEVDLSKPVQIIAKSSSGTAYIVYELFLDGKSQNGWQYIFCDETTMCYKKLPVVTIDIKSDSLYEPTLTYLVYARSISGVWSDPRQITQKKQWESDFDLI